MTNKEDTIQSKILLNAQKLFQKGGLKKTTMDEIAAKCGKAKSTLYHYYNSKMDVFDAVVEMELLNLRRHVKSKVDEQKNMLDRLKTYIREFHKEVINKKNLYRIIKQKQSNELYRNHLLSIVSFEQSYISRILEDGYDLKELREIKREEIGWVSEMFLVAFLGLVFYSIEKDGFLDEDKLNKAIDFMVPKIFG
nr:TetR/AcrR family transcriptional regulator [uncultured Draconibacterium sp.]